MVDPDSIGRKTDEELAREARAGSRWSFEELALRYKHRLFVYFRPRLGSDQDAEDLVQETFLKLYRNIHHYDAAHKFSTWLYTSAHRLAISSYRKKRTAAGRVNPEVADHAGDPAVRASGDTRSTVLWDAAGTLGGSQYRVLWLRYGEDLAIEEIASSIGKSRLAVRLLLHRARTNLMKRVGPAPGRAVAKTVAVGETPPG
ncbi:MAG: sigma-70 family RNA polymerase sigma factor [Candidatus Aminicenantes bacterium]|nr:sigma-70 family RNA polymerase sigma factor [Candidatus Aminicenantes bacterium]